MQMHDRTERMTSIARLISATLPGEAFLVLAVDKDGIGHYVANGKREQCAMVMKEFLHKWEHSNN